jgi:serine/threonine protein kinase
MDSSTENGNKRPVRPPRRLATELVGTTIAGRYRIRDIVGTGGMGTVYGATDLVTGEEVAIKSLNAASYTSVNLRRLRREAEICANTRHEHLCRVYHLGVDNGTPFIVMERLIGETLRKRLRRDGPLPVADAIAIMLQILDALGAAHAMGVLHRDVKPSNVLITTPPGHPPRIKLIDFGLARPLRPGREPRFSADDTAITATDIIPGTPQYLTPEQLDGARDLDERVDVWAAALTLVEMLTGAPVFQPTRVHELLVTAILARPAPSVSGDRSDVPADLDVVLAKALAKDRTLRTRSAEELRSAIVDVWARHRALGIARGKLLKRAPERLPARQEIVRSPAAQPSLGTEIEIIIDSSSQSSSSDGVSR